MLLYNVTIGVDEAVVEEWVTWMREIHIPDVMKTGHFRDFRFYRILHDNEDGTVSFSVQYFAETIQEVQEYLEFHAPGLIAEHQRMFKNRHVAFRTLLEEI